MRQSSCNGPSDSAGDVAVGGVRVAPCLRTATVQTVSADARLTSRGGRHMGGHTCARTAVLAVQEDPPSPAVRPGPIHGMGRSVRCRAHHLTGSASVALNDADGNRPTSARTFFVRPEQGNESEPARAGEHGSMRMMRQSDRKVERTHLKALLETFERPLSGASHLPLFPHFARHLTRDWRAV